MAAIEVIHHMKDKTKGKVGDIALKLDISKAYDRIDWIYLREILSTMGFSQKWVKWIMLCVETVYYSVNLNGNKVGPIITGRDDCFLFFKAAHKEAIEIKNILVTYEEASGQSINLQKSELFCSRNVSTEIKDMLADTLGVRQVLGTANYLGVPSMIGRSRKGTFKYIKDRVWKKLNSWSSRSLSQAGRETLIKSVIQAIPSYIMSIFLLPPSLSDELEIMMNSFWWGHNRNIGKGLNWLSWDKLSISKRNKGMGFRNLSAFNYAMLGKQAWNIMTNPDNLVTKLFKARYFPNCDFLDSGIGHNPSYVWRSVWSSKFLIRGGLPTKRNNTFSTVLWSLWKCRNNLIWNQLEESTDNICNRAMNLLFGWRNAQTTKNSFKSQSNSSADLSWSKPVLGRLKCNIDASFSNNKVGIDACIRDDKGSFIAART
ncbi:uncharacterized protein LOC131614368 [Vicia villosa]|uniref:uncharacterized protein LOC131614368 n=1 Tax=Vicia villosa TaxID=3911 RepID=UPI00273B243B|nr:uncharacterized protein LOC131614368 [Vicia villosa]